MPRRLAAILVADVVGYSRLMRADEAGTISALQSHREDIFSPALAQWGGRLVKLMGDGSLVEFASVVDAVEAALQIQRESSATQSPIRLRIGVNLGDIVVEEDDIYGDGVNVAARLETLAEPDGICISSIVYESLNNLLEERFEDAGEHVIKGMDEPVRVFRWPSAGKTRPQIEKPSIAILPFENVSNAPEDEYFSLGTTDDIATDLSKISGLVVISRDATRDYAGSGATPGQVGRELGVRYVLSGSVRRGNGRVRVNARLVDAQTENQLWAERFDGKLEEIFEFQDHITESIVTTLSVSMTRAEQERAFSKETKNLRAYDYVLQGNAFHSRFTRADNAKALELYSRALELAPEYAPAHAGFAWAMNHQSNQEWGEDKAAAMDLALKHAKQAVALDSSLAKAHLALADVYCWQRQHTLAVAEGQKAVELEPSNADAHFALSYYLITAGRPEEAKKEALLSLRYNPVHSIGAYHENLGISHYLTYEFESALSALEEGVARRPNYDGLHQWLAATYAQLGRLEDAKKQAREYMELKPHVTLDKLAKRLPYKRKSDLDLLLDGLRKAGVPN